MQNNLFQAAPAPSSDNCWAEFSIDAAFSAELNELCQQIQNENKHGTLKSPSQHHVSLLYGYSPHESQKLMDIVRKHFKSPLTLTAREVTRGDVSAVILLHIQPSAELNALFHELYHNVGKKKHTLINGGYDPHITIAISDQTTLDTVNLEKFKNKFIGRTFTIDSVFSLDEDQEGKNILLDEFNTSVNAAYNLMFL